VLGTGPEARLVEASLVAAHPPGLRLLGFFPLDKVTETAVSQGQVIGSGQDLVALARDLKVNEIIVAVRQQRGGVLPLRELLDCRLHGMEITDLARFFERVHSKVPIELLKVSWLIYGNGYRQGWLRSSVKRVFDLAAALTLLLLTLPIMGMTALAIRLESKGPFVYRQQRVGYRGRAFTVFKFRSMGVDAEMGGQARWAVARDPRVTRVGRIIRRLRIDELPQLFNVLRGEMSFVGPRPPLRQYVERFPDLYAAVLRSQPGITGLATLTMHGWEERLLRSCRTAEETDAVYMRRSVPRKARLDMIYQRHASVGRDAALLARTIARLLRPYRPR
jgi:lipopolysaccharide/colanic/teichoic acid biosynthesis glycosyltransferase